MKEGGFQRLSSHMINYMHVREVEESTCDRNHVQGGDGAEDTKQPDSSSNQSVGNISGTIYACGEECCSVCVQRCVGGSATSAVPSDIILCRSRFEKMHLVMLRLCRVVFVGRLAWSTKVFSGKQETAGARKSRRM